MGGNFSNLTSKQALDAFITQEYERARNKKRDYLVLSEILSVNLPDDYIFKFCHIGNLFCMDANKDGRFSLEDLLAYSVDAL